MSHLPMAIKKEKPETLLDLCFLSDLLPCVGCFIPPSAYLFSFPAVLMYHFVLTLGDVTSCMQSNSALLSYFKGCHNAP